MDDELRAALRRGAPDLDDARRFAAPDNPIAGGTLAWRLDRRGVRVVLDYLEHEPRAAVARLEAENADLRDAFGRNERARDILRDGVNHLAQDLVAATAEHDEARAERDAARAALRELIDDVEDIARIAHDQYHRETPGSWRGCGRMTCYEARDAVARARAATGADDGL